MNIQTIVEKELIGKILTGSEFGVELKNPDKITGVCFGKTEGDNDPCLWLTLENGEEFSFYLNDDIFVSPVRGV